MPSCPVQVLSDTLISQAANPTPVTEREQCALLRELGTVPDPRDARGIRYPVAGMLAAAVTAVCTGAVTFTAISDRIKTLTDAELTALGLPGRPVMTTLWRLLCRVDALALGQALTRWLLNRQEGPTPCRSTPSRLRVRVVSIDGKTVRGTCRAKAPGRKTHVLSAFDTREGIVLSRALMDTKGGETALFKPLITESVRLLAGTGEQIVFVADAQQTQKANLTEVAALGAHLLVPIKRNHPSTYATVKALPWATVPVGHTMRDSAHGRKETRTLKAITIATPGGLGIGFETAVRAVRITRTRTINGVTTRETAFLITTLPAEEADPGDINLYARLEWHIENRLHHVKDVTLREDEQRARTGNGPAVFSVLREVCIGFHRQRGYTNIAEGIRAAVRPVPEVITALTSR